MKKLLAAFLTGSASLLLFAQRPVTLEQKETMQVKPSSSGIVVERLSNGLTVILYPNRHLPQVFGAVAVRAGGKYDPADHTGMAHYLEHMLFKGTRRLGTVNYAAERPYLDSITFWYDRLPQAKNEAERIRILKTINRLSIKAAEYAIPNELNTLLRYAGGQGINAFTHFDKVVYHNSFPPHQIEKWLDIYAHRFHFPVFRLFQSELEVVYEEKNRAMDNFSGHLMDTIQKTFFRNHPYRQSILGETPHLKNPSLSEMYRYFRRYYRPNNMALVLVGDFDPAEVLPVVREKFSILEAAPVPPFSPPSEPPFHGREVVKLRISPLRLGVAAFRVCPDPAPDAPVMHMISRLLSNDNGIGLLDSLVREGKLLAASPIPLLLQDQGMMAFFFMPKMLGQSLRRAERMVLAQVERLKTGDYPDALFETVKNELVREAELRYESNTSVAMDLVDAFIYGIDPEKFLHRTDRYREITKKDVAEVARRYFGPDYLLIQSRMGKPKKEKLPRPPFEPIQKTAAGKESQYAKYYKHIPEKSVKLQPVDFNRDVRLRETGRYALYHVPNPINEIAELTFRWKVGSLHDSLLPYVIDYLNLVGSERYPATAMGRELGRLGYTYDLSVSNNYVRLRLTGLENNLEKALDVVMDWLGHPERDPSKIKVVYRQHKASYKSLLHDPPGAARVVRDYVMYGQYSPYLQQLPLDRIKKLKVPFLLEKWKEVLARPFEVHYVGRTAPDMVQHAIDVRLDRWDVKEMLPAVPYRERPMQRPRENAIYYAARKDAIQSSLYFYQVPEVPPHREDLPYVRLFNRYFGADMSSLMFQTLREFRSLAYSAWASLMWPSVAGGRLYLYGSLGTQADKTIEAVKVTTGLLRAFPINERHLEDLVVAERNAVVMNMPSMRRRSFYVARWRRMGWEEDPTRFLWEVYGSLSVSEASRKLQYVHDLYVREYPLVFMGAVDPTRSRLETLGGAWKLHVLDPKKLIRK